jgi:hypothetical protein
LIVALGVTETSGTLIAVAQGAMDVEEIRAILLHERAERALGHRELIDVRRAIVAVMSEEIRRTNPVLRLAAAGGITRRLPPVVRTALTTSCPSSSVNR